MPLMALLHRQYKTARTETRCHLLLKIWQMAIQTSASRGYVFFQQCHKRYTRILKLSAGCGHIPWSVQSLKRHGSSGMPGAVRIRNARFCDQNCYRQFHPEHFIILCFTCPCFSPPRSRDAPCLLCVYDSTIASPQGASVRTAPSATGVSVKSSVPVFPVWVIVCGSPE